MGAEGGGQGRSRVSWLPGAIVVAALVVLAVGVSMVQVPDPDMYHGMVLAKAALERGHVPREDLFAYTPTVEPVVHHEWAWGLMLYLAMPAAGAAGLLALRYLLMAAIVAVCIACARRRGAGWVLIAALSPLAAALLSIGFTTVRAQVFTLLAMALLLLMLDEDRRGKRWWIAAWLPLHILWVNIHGGFVVGCALLAAHWAERVVRERRLFPHLIATGLATGLAVLVNPYGWEFVPGILASVTMDRPLVTEWVPLWHNGVRLGFYAFSLLILAYAVARRGWRDLPGLLIVLLTAYAALRHTRHLSLYAVAWSCYVPGYLAGTPLVGVVERLWSRWRWGLAGLAGAMGLAATVRMPHWPWELKIPVAAADAERGLPLYPAGAMDYLEQAGFRGNVMTPFTAGGYVSWRLWPDAKVSMDGRYEVAYPPAMVEEQHAAYQGRPGWEAVLAKHATDVILVERHVPLSGLLEGQGEWKRVYRDGGYSVYARPGLELPAVDRGDEAVAGRFP